MAANDNEKKQIIEQLFVDYYPIDSFINIEERFICSICHRIFFNPVICYNYGDGLEPCNHVFCKNCILHWLETCQNCPLCQRDLQPKELFDYIILRREIESLKVKCNYPSCTWTSELSKDGKLLKQHLEQCEYQYMICSHCSLKIKCAEEKDHLLICPDVICTCSHSNNGCPVSLKRSRIVQHETICEFAFVECINFKDGCLPPILRRDFNSHMIDCIYTTIPCPNKNYGCDISIKKFELKDHLLECKYIIVSCPFLKFGCDEQILKYQFDAHLRLQFLKHQLLMASSIDPLKIFNESQQLQRQVIELMSRITDIEQSLSTRIANIEQSSSNRITNIEQLLKSYLFTRRNLTKLDFTNQNLQDFQFHGSILQHANFQGANIMNCNFKYCKMKQTNLHEATISPTTLFHMATTDQMNWPQQINNLNLQKHDLSNQDLSSYSWTHVDLRKANITNTILPYDLSYSNLSGLDLSNHDLTGRNFSFAILDDTKFPTNCSNINFTGVNLSRRSFQHYNFNNCNFTNANLRGVDFTQSNLNNANFTNANLTKAIFDHANNENINLSNATLKYTKLC